MIIIGVTGSFGAGKGEVADYLVNRKGFKHYSARRFIFEEAKRRGLDISKGREVLIPVGNDLRREHGPAYIIESLYKQAVTEGVDAVIESLRVVAEVKRLQELGGYVIGVDADPHLRFERSIKRGSETDSVSYEEWIDHERRESNSHDPAKQDIFGALKASDCVVQNNGTKEELHDQIKEALKKLEAR